MKTRTILLDHGFDANGRSMRWDENRRLLAVATEWTDHHEPRREVVLLLDRGAAVDVMDDSPRTALRYAVSNSNTATVQTLLLLNE